MMTMTTSTRSTGRRSRVKKAFTLVELMVVVGLMGLMTTIAIGSYSAITRGMNDRAALDAAKSLADAALQRANLDRTPVYIYLFNEVTKLDSEMEAGIACGVAIAVRPIGRITHVPEGGFYCDEFGDLDGTFDALDEKGDEASQGEKEDSAATFFRLYNIGKRGYATVQEGVYAYELNDRDLEDGDAGAMHKWIVHGFKTAKGDSGDTATFEVGDQYGQEFVVTRLPPGYVFSQTVSMSGTSDLGQKRVGNIIEVRPTDTSTPAIQIYARRPNGSFDSIGSTGNVKDGEK